MTPGSKMASGTHSGGWFTPGAGSLPGLGLLPGQVHSQGWFTHGAGSLPGKVHSRGVPGLGASGPRNCSNPTLTGDQWGTVTWVCDSAMI